MRAVRCTAPAATKANRPAAAGRPPAAPSVDGAAPAARDWRGHAPFRALRRHYSLGAPPPPAPSNRPLRGRFFNSRRMVPAGQTAGDAATRATRRKDDDSEQGARIGSPSSAATASGRRSAPRRSRSSPRPAWTSTPPTSTSEPPATCVTAPSSPTRRWRSSAATTPSSSAPSARRWATPPSRPAPSSAACCSAPLRARPLRQPAPLHRRARVHRRGGGLRRGAGEHRGHLRRRGRVPAQGDPARGGHPGLGEHAHGRGALRALRLRAGRPAQQATSPSCTRPTC